MTRICVKQPSLPSGNGSSGLSSLFGKKERGGFLKVIAVYDWADNGGDADGEIDAGDAIYSRLRLWRDANHNGASEAGELRTLASVGVVPLSLAYKESKRTDEYGSGFRYRAKLSDAKGANVTRWAWDVFLAKAP